MPTGYQCRMCEEFSGYTHKMSEVNLRRVTFEDMTKGDSKYTLCPGCATRVRAFILDVDLPEEVV